ncbi:MAG: hypothetical protein WD316_05360 [Phycisphaeraceae bacterium]
MDSGISGIRRERPPIATPRLQVAKAIVAVGAVLGVMVAIVAVDLAGKRHASVDGFEVAISGRFARGHPWEMTIRSDGWVTYQAKGSGELVDQYQADEQALQEIERLVVKYLRRTDATFGDLVADSARRTITVHEGARSYTTTLLYMSEPHQIEQLWCAIERLLRDANAHRRCE